MAQIISVYELNHYVKMLLESDEVLTGIAVKGEIGNFVRNAKSGHCYFSIKDGKASVKAVMFRNDADRLAFLPENGMDVVVRCRVSLYERDGAFQLYVQDVFPSGVGAAQMAFEQLKERLLEEGLFAEEAKKPLPAFPRRVGLVTSKTGAALQDILKVAAYRCPTARFVLAPVSVQGNEAAPAVAEAIQALDHHGLVDVIIVARGGGSAEDLWVFNDEQIARAAFACRTPLVSAIGHEIDFTILDFVADLRAPTPSAAAEQVLPDLHAYMQNMQRIYTNITRTLQENLNLWYNQLTDVYKHPAMQALRARPAAELFVLRKQAGRTQNAVRKLWARKQEIFSSCGRLAASLNPYATLARGYAAIEKDGQPLPSIAGVGPGDAVLLTLTDGRLDCRVETVHPNQEKNNGG